MGAISAIFIDPILTILIDPMTPFSKISKILLLKKESYLKICFIIAQDTKLKKSVIKT